MLPLLHLADDGNEHRISEAVEQLAQMFHLSSDELTELRGTKTVDQVRADTNRRKIERRASPFRNGERVVIPCCGLEAWLLPCGHAKGSRWQDCLRPFRLR